VAILQCPFITHAGIATAILHRPDLYSLSITCEPTEFDNYYSHFTSSLATLKSLTCLDLSSSCINDSLFNSLALQSPPLTKLVLQGCYGYTYSGIFNLLSKCPSMQHLDLRGANF
jgi:hypothetical protein